LANTKSAEKAARQSTVHRARNDALTSQLRSAIRKATLALKAGKQDEAASALAAATPVIDSMVNKGIIHRNKAARHKSRLTKQVRALAKYSSKPGLRAEFHPLRAVSESASAAAPAWDATTRGCSSR
jgi:small subunit ribosomal protein S20